MTFQQLRYAVQIEKSGSLSKAAKKLFVSQPNLSSAIKELESECGYTIFNRSNRGVEITEQGKIFLAYARSVLKQCDEMKNISSNSNKSSLKLAAQNYSPIMEAFVKYVKFNSSAEKINFEMMNAQGFDVIDKVYKHDADLGIILILESMTDQFSEHLNDRNLSFTTLGKLPFFINLRKNHPALEVKENFLYELQNYPAVLYRDSTYNQREDWLDSGYFDFINPEKLIYVFDRDMKFKIMSETDAYGIGTKLHPNFSKYYDWIRIPIPDVYVKIGYIHGINRPMKAEAQSFIELLKTELEGLVI